MVQLIQLAGAMLVLAGFGLNQLGVLSSASSTYLALNIVGAGVLAALAFAGQQWGFLLLEGVWATMALVALMTRARGRESKRPLPDNAAASSGGPPPKSKS
jgi:hypothetical protein